MLNMHGTDPKFFLRLITKNVHKNIKHYLSRKGEREVFEDDIPYSTFSNTDKSHQSETST